MDGLLLSGPATLWGILISDHQEEWLHDDSEAPYSDTERPAEEDFETDDDGETESTSPASSATLWGILQSEPEIVESDSPDTATAVTDLWKAAGYDCPLPLEEPAPSPGVKRTMLENEERSSQAYQPLTPIGPYIVKVSPGKGQGIFATRSITKGERLLTDEPFFIVSKPYNDDRVLSEFEKMSLAKRKLYMQLTCPDRPAGNSYRTSIPTDVMRIFEANCFNIGDRAAVFWTATRFNHSCLPNTYYSWRESSGKIVFHAMCDVPREEELTICYGRPFRTRAERKSDMRIYNFECGCEACCAGTEFGWASDVRRVRMRGLEEGIALAREGVPGSWGEGEVLEAAMKLIELVQEEGLRGEPITPYREAADSLKAMGRFEEAVVFASLKLEEEVLCLGVDSDIVAGTRAYVRELEVGLRERRQQLGRNEEASGTPLSEKACECLDVDTETRKGRPDSQHMGLDSPYEQPARQLKEMDLDTLKDAACKLIHPSSPPLASFSPSLSSAGNNDKDDGYNERHDEHTTNAE